ncbi:MAG: ABC transporter permease [bacterium]|nr:ABC transporter permease [bacterium]
MKRSTLLLRGLIHFRWTHAAVICGSAIGAAVLVGALVVGDSVRHSLRWLVSARLGSSEFAVTSGERFMQTDFADELGRSLGVATAPVIVLDGVASADGGRARVNRIQVVGVDDRFWSIGGMNSPGVANTENRAALNRHLADRLGVAVDDEVIVRIERLNQVPSDMPYRSRQRNTLSMRLTVGQVAEDDEFGRFSMRAQQAAPLTVFIPMTRLAEALGLESRCNLILVAGKADGALTGAELEATVRDRWSLGDVGLRLRELPDELGLELQSERVFLSSEVACAAMAVDASAQAVLTYFVNALSAGDRSTPYSFVTGLETPSSPSPFGVDEIVINEWLANDLGVGPGAQVELSYFSPNGGSRLVESSIELRVAEVVPVVAVDRFLMPELPGLADAKSCGDWDESLPIDLTKVRDKDEDYWDTYRGTPKAFLRLATAQRLWSNRFGELTAVRFPNPTSSMRDIEGAILANLDPENLGIAVTPVLADGLQSADQAVDFGHLFLGLSFFIVVGSLLLTGLVFVLGVEQRNQESGVLRAVGFTVREVGWLHLVEGGFLAAFGTVIGAVGGVVFAQTALVALKTVWRGAIGSAVLIVHVEPLSLLIGGMLGFALAVTTMALAHRSSSARSVCELLRGGHISQASARGSGRRMSGVLAVLCAAGATSLAGISTFAVEQDATGAFFGVGSLLLLATVFGSLSWLSQDEQNRPLRIPSLAGLALSEAARKRRRSVVTITLIACGVFCVVAVAANRRSSVADAELRSSGTGGFSFYGETSLPIEDNLNTSVAKRRFGLPSEGVRFVQLRRHVGDDASCLNLNRASRPNVLGVPVEELKELGAFGFTQVAPGVDVSDPWDALNSVKDADVIPAVADQAVITWGLGLSIGDLLWITDEQGNEVALKLVGGLTSSLLQGNLLISETHFRRLFPSLGGSHVFLVDADTDLRSEVEDALRTGMRDVGLEIQTASGRLESFRVVENTYLSIFLALGGLGLALGIAGVAIIVLRDVIGRRAELAALRAIGFGRSAIGRLLAIEYGVLIAVGLVGGTLSALVAVLPSLMTSGSGTPWLFMALVLGVIAASGTGSIFAAVVFAVRGDLVSALRNE